MRGHCGTVFNTRFDTMGVGKEGNSNGLGDAKNIGGNTLAAVNCPRSDVDPADRSLAINRMMFAKPGVQDERNC